MGEALSEVVSSLVVALSGVETLNHVRFFDSIKRYS